MLFYEHAFLRACSCKQSGNCEIGSMNRINQSDCFSIFRYSDKSLIPDKKSQFEKKIDGVRLWLDVELFLLLIFIFVSFTEIGIVTFFPVLNGRGKPTILKVCT